ncbi:endonuclease domain-containing protein [Novipirellula caenicola]|uniref:DUF559 domain-containing protein n=1 Tax=Novipirellula caenicola TaxID=1536901 RepID=A0ABP9W0Y5_9BACT
MASGRDRIARARALRNSQTRAEGLLWSLLRSKQLCGLKFRRQHPVDPYLLDIACLSHHLDVELDGEYHDQIAEGDLKRQRYLEALGWKVICFQNEDVLEDAESVLRAIARELGITYLFHKRTRSRSGNRSENSPGLRNPKR